MRKHREELIKKLNDLVKDDPRIGSAKKALSIGAEHPQPIKEALDAIASPEKFSSWPELFRHENYHIFL